MKSPDDDDNRRFHEAIKHIQVIASQLTLEAMENHYYQLVLTLQTKLSKTSKKNYCIVCNNSRNWSHRRIR